VKLCSRDPEGECCERCISMLPDECMHLCLSRSLGTSTRVQLDLYQSLVRKELTYEQRVHNYNLLVLTSQPYKACAFICGQILQTNTRLLRSPLSTVVLYFRHAILTHNPRSKLKMWLVCRVSQKKSGPLKIGSMTNLWMWVGYYFHLGVRLVFLSLLYEFQAFRITREFWFWCGFYRWTQLSNKPNIFHI